MIFAYVRISTKSQTTDSQVSDIQTSYPDIEISTDVCCGTVPAIEREQLNRLLDKLRKDDVLVVWWIDRLGRDYHDSETTIRELLNRVVIIKIIELLEQGLSVREVAMRVGCNPSTVQRAKKRRDNVQIQP